jgi:hypothetical protein
MTRHLARRLLGLTGIMLAILAPARAANVDAFACHRAASVAEASERVPSGLLGAIGDVESRRTDTTGMRAPWPWTIHADGVGRFFATVDEAVAAVRLLLAAGVQSIDIGCFQINLLQHPYAFPDLASGFDPLINALAAAHFLASLRTELGAWEPAVAAYHSRRDEFGGPYRDEVLAVWHGTQTESPTGFAHIHVWGPNGEILDGSGMTSLVATPIVKTVRGHAGGLPRVITVSTR